MGRQTLSGFVGGGLGQIAGRRLVRLGPAEGPFDDAGILNRFASDHDLFCRARSRAVVIQKNAVLDGKIAAQLAHDPEVARQRPEAHSAACQKDIRLDWTGFLALSIALACLQLVLDRGERLRWCRWPPLLTIRSAVRC